MENELKDGKLVVIGYDSENAVIDINEFNDSTSFLSTISQGRSFNRVEYTFTPFDGSKSFKLIVSDFGFLIFPI